MGASIEERYKSAPADYYCKMIEARVDGTKFDLAEPREDWRESTMQ